MDEEQEPGRGLMDRRPIPDPTALTTAQLHREIDALRTIITTRLDANDKAVVTLQNLADRMPTPAIVHADLLALRELTTTKFTSIDTRFVERDMAVKAALDSSKEVTSEQNRSSAVATAKSEATIQKQMDQQSTLIVTSTQSLRDMIDDIKGRLIRLEEGRFGAREQKDDQRSDRGASLQTMSLVIAFGLGLIAFVNFVLSKFPNAPSP